MPTFRVLSRGNFLELLVLRRAIGIRKTESTLTREQESRLYQALVVLTGWMSVSAEYDVINPSTFTEVRKSVSRSMHELLTTFKFNDEPSDTTTRDVMEGMAAIPQNRRSRRMLASICAAINGRGFLAKMLDNVAGLSRMGLYDRAKRIIGNSSRDAKLFTSSFNKQTYNRKGHKQIALNRLEACKRATKKVYNMRTVKRKYLQLTLVKEHGLLLGKNAYSYLERSYSRMGFASTKRGDGRCGTVLGPGAQAGANVLFRKVYKQEGIGTSFADALASFGKSRTALRRLRAELRGILRKLVRMQRCLRTPVAKGRGQLLIRAATELLRATDCEQQFLLCELGKISVVVLTLSQNYARDGGMGDGESDDIGDSDSCSSDEESV